jgi:hypothetical protein
MLINLSAVDKSLASAVARNLGLEVPKGKACK